MLNVKDQSVFQKSYHEKLKILKLCRVSHTKKNPPIY